MGLPGFLCACSFFPCRVTLEMVANAIFSIVSTLIINRYKGRCFVTAILPQRCCPIIRSFACSTHKRLAPTASLEFHGNSLRSSKELRPRTRTSFVQLNELQTCKHSSLASSKLTRIYSHQRQPKSEWGSALVY